jgi:hypothetical protein
MTPRHPQGGLRSGASAVRLRRAGRPVQADAIAAIPLGGVEGGVRPGQSGLDPPLADGHDRDPDAGGHGHGRSVHGEGLTRRRPAQPLGDGDGGDGIGLIEHDQEFLAAPAGDDVVLAHHVAKPLREADQNRVAALVSVGVVDRFEMVDVGQQDRAARRCGHAAGPPSHRREQPAPVRQTGERIGLCQAAELQLRALVHHGQIADLDEDAAPQVEQQRVDALLGRGEALAREVDHADRQEEDEQVSAEAQQDDVLCP